MASKIVTPCNEQKRNVLTIAQKTENVRKSLFRQNRSIGTPNSPSVPDKRTFSVLPLVSLTDWVTLRPLFAFSLVRLRFFFGQASSRSDDEPSGGYALHYESSYERNFVMRIFVKRGVTVCLNLLSTGK
jgi:hypothetical protein